MTTVYLSESDKSDKKYKAYFPDRNKTVHFGAKGYEDYTKHKDKERKERYIHRHSQRENWDNFYTAGFWSRWLLWNKPTIKGSIKDIKQRYGLKIIV